LSGKPGQAGAAQITAAATQAGAFAISNGQSADSALMISLPPGNYSAQATSASGGGGQVLLEVYEVP